MGRVLIVASHFPPNAPNGVMRVAKLIKYLPEYGWESFVLTSTLLQSNVSDNLLKDVAAARQVFRTPSFDIRKNKMLRIIIDNVSSIRAFLLYHNHLLSDAKKNEANTNTEKAISSYFMVPDYLVNWIPGAVLQGLRTVRKYDVDVILSLSPLPSGLLVGYWLHRLTGKPWVIDFRDPWTTNPFTEKKSFSFLEKLDTALECTVLKAANHIIVINKYFISPLQKKYPNLLDEKFTIIPNGYDPQDFAHLTPKSFDRFTILHTGNFYGHRKATTFLKGLYILLDQQPTLREQIQVLFVGNLDFEGRACLARLALADVVHTIEPVPHRTSLEYILGADLLLLIPGPGVGTMTGKIFEYLAAQKPIFAIAESGVVKDTIISFGIGEVADPVDDTQIANKLFHIIQLIKSKKFIYPLNLDLLNSFDRRQIAGQVAQVLQDVSAQKG